MNWKPFGDRWHEFDEAGLARPGTFVKFKHDNEIYLVGNINTTSGLCDCCDFRHRIIEAYDDSLVATIEEKVKK